MKNIQSTFRLFALLVVLLWSFQSQAQRQRPNNVSPEKIAEKQTAQQVEKLGLSKDEAKKLKTINLKYAKQIQAKVKSRREREQKYVAELKEIGLARNDEIKSILSEEQFRNYIELQQQNITRMRASDLGRREEVEKRRKEQIEALNLSKEQKTKMRVLKMKYGNKMAQLKQQGKSEETKVEMILLNKSMDSEVKEILSEEQFEKYLELKSQRQRMRKAKMEKKPR